MKVRHFILIVITEEKLNSFTVKWTKYIEIRLISIIEINLSNQSY